MKPEGKKTLKAQACKWDDNINTDNKNGLGGRGLYSTRS
jgi:hypothetical protein